MQNPSKPLYLNPHWLAQIGAVPVAGRFVVYAVPYTSTGYAMRSWSHRTLRAAGRRLGSVITGKLRRGGDHAAFVVAPDGTIHNWYTANGKPAAA